VSSKPAWFREFRPAWTLAFWLVLGLAPTLLSSAEAPPSSRRIEDALSILARVPTGKELMLRAVPAFELNQPSDLPRVFRWGDASRTDAVLTRHYNPVTGKERRERQVTIYLRPDQKLQSLVLDIAHELVHATSRPSWDPYDPTLTPGRYILASIDGEGGEVDALVAECKVAMELAAQFGARAGRCQGYLSDLAARDYVIERERVRRDFYRVGEWGSELRRRLGRELDLFPLLSQDKPRLFSSTGNAPYPVALLREFEQITQVACENTRKRVSEGSASIARSPASEGPAAQFLQRRCQART
jgi:hypothetical protein